MPIDDYCMADIVMNAMWWIYIVAVYDIEFYCTVIIKAGFVLLLLISASLLLNLAVKFK